MNSTRIFISSVQSESQQERELLRNYIRDDPMIRRFFDVFLFEDAPASNHNPNQLYLNEVENSDIYLGLFGNELKTKREFLQQNEHLIMRHLLDYIG